MNKYLLGIYCRKEGPSENPATEKPPGHFIDVELRLREEHPELGTVAHSCSPAAQETEAGEFQVRGQHWQLSKTLVSNFFYKRGLGYSSVVEYP